MVLCGEGDLKLPVAPCLIIGQLINMVGWTQWGGGCQKPLSEAIGCTGGSVGEGAIRAIVPQSSFIAGFLGKMFFTMFGPVDPRPNREFGFDPGGMSEFRV